VHLGRQGQSVQVYDLDGDGLLSQDDLRSMLLYMVGGELSEEQCQEFLAKCTEEAGTISGINFATFCKHADISELDVQVPTGF
jgi:Ca2+-binding EF-hand superfamily protein